MKIRDLLKEVDVAVERRDPHVVIDGKVVPLVEHPAGVRKVVLELTGSRMMVIESLGGAERTIPGNVVRNFGKRVLRVHKGYEVQVGEERRVVMDLQLDGAIDGAYVQDVELECTRIVLGVKTPAIAQLAV